MSIIFLGACGGSIVTTAPIRVASISVEASASDTRCDGSFDGSGKAEATWPAPPPSGKAAAVSTLSKKDVERVGFNFTPTTANFGATEPDRVGITISDGSLDDVCQNGSFALRASTVSNTSPPAPAALDDSPPVTVNQVGFKIASPIEVDIRTARDFDVKFKLSCCPPPAAGVWQVQVVSTTNVDGALRWTPAPPQITCPGADVSFVGKGKKRETHPRATVQLKVQKVGGRSCALGTGIVEGI